VKGEGEGGVSVIEVLHIMYEHRIMKPIKIILKEREGG
jgi:hypothetical protein